MQHRLAHLGPDRELKTLKVVRRGHLHERLAGASSNSIGKRKRKWERSGEEEREIRRKRWKKRKKKKSKRKMFGFVRVLNPEYIPFLDFWSKVLFLRKLIHVFNF